MEYYSDEKPFALLLIENIETLNSNFLFQKWFYSNLVTFQYITISPYWFGFKNSQQELDRLARSSPTFHFQDVILDKILWYWHFLLQADMEMYNFSINFPVTSKDK